MAVEVVGFFDAPHGTQAVFQAIEKILSPGQVSAYEVAGSVVLRIDTDTMVFESCPVAGTDRSMFEGSLAVPLADALSIVATMSNALQHAEIPHNLAVYGEAVESAYVFAYESPPTSYRPL